MSLKNVTIWPSEEELIHVPNRDPIGHRDKEAIAMARSNRPFVAWDGEGITYSGNPQQAYVLFAASTGDSFTAAEGNSITTEECFSLMFRVEQQIPDAYHIGFGFSYDVNQILNSLSRSSISALAHSVRTGTTFKWRDYRIKLHPGKFFQVSKGNKDDGTYGCIKIYDTFGFWQRSFLKVVKAYFPERVSEIEHGKSNRNAFTYAEIDEIRKYCGRENQLLVDIMDQLRANLAERGIYPTDWHGPGAIASASLKANNAKKFMGEVPRRIQQISKYAYQGGRFELLRAGYYNGKVYQYDINSAYPSVIRELPSLANGHWRYTKRYERSTFSVWHVRYCNKTTDRDDRFSLYRAEPLFYRDRMGRVSYPPIVEGWYWEPEVSALIDLVRPKYTEIVEGWVFEPSSDARPFAYFNEKYAQRLEDKKLGLGGLELVDKLEMNSYYGKFAQRSGWFKFGDKIPSYHQLEWAGYVTSATRAKLFRAYCKAPGSIFSFETDAVFSTTPLDLDTGNQLGQWGLKVLDDILYIQSGFYFAHHSDGIIEHYRGFDKDSLNFEMVMEWLSKVNPTSFKKPEARLFGTSKRFIGFKRALLSRNPRYWRTWDTSPREITIGRDGKRIHGSICPICRDILRSHSANSAYSDGFHYLNTPIIGGRSKPHKIPWSDKDDIWDKAGKWDLLDNSDKWDKSDEWVDWDEEKESDILDGRPG